MLEYCFFGVLKDMEKLNVDSSRKVPDGSSQRKSSGPRVNDAHQKLRSARRDTVDLVNVWGVRSEEILLDHIPSGVSVLDVGSGSGIIARRIRDEKNCNLKAIEPGIEKSNSAIEDAFDASKYQLGEETVAKLTLQDAVKHEEYRHQFDVVSVHKYNVRLTDRDAFIQASTQAIKSDGQVIIHVVERQRVVPTKGFEQLYMLPTLEEFFHEVNLNIRETSGEVLDAIIVCKRPKSLDL